MKNIIADGYPYKDVQEVTITGGKYNDEYDVYKDSFAYVHLETNTIFITLNHYVLSKLSSPLLACDVDGTPMIPLFASDFDYVVSKEEEK